MSREKTNPHVLKIQIFIKEQTSCLFFYFSSFNIFVVQTPLDFFSFFFVLFLIFYYSYLYLYLTHFFFLSRNSVSEQQKNALQKKSQCGPNEKHIYK